MTFYVEYTRALTFENFVHGEKYRLGVRPRLIKLRKVLLSRLKRRLFVRRKRKIVMRYMCVWRERGRGK